MPGGAADRVVLAEQGAIVVERLVELGLAAAEPRRVLGTALARGQLGQAFEGGDIARIGRDGLLEGLAFRGGVAPASGEPRLELVDARRSDVVRADVGQGLAGLVHAVRGHRPVEPGAPDDRVVGPASTAGVEPGLRLGQPAVAQGQVGPAQPDAVVLRGLPDGAVERRSHPVDGQGIEAQGQVELEHRLRLAMRAGASASRQISSASMRTSSNRPSSQ